MNKKLNPVDGEYCPPKFKECFSCTDGFTDEGEICGSCSGSCQVEMTDEDEQELHENNLDREADLNE